MAAFPTFLCPRMTVSLAPEVRRRPLIGSGPNAKKLALAIEPQQQANWCWAAVSTSVSHYYDAASQWTQCLVANAALPRSDCCADGASDPSRCNIPWVLDTALNVTGHFDRMIWSALSFGDLQNQIAADAPIGCRVAWDQWSAHFMLIVGWLVADSGAAYINVADPIYLETQIPFEEFAESYQSGGDWTHTYLTSRAPTGGGSSGDVIVSSLDAGAIGA